MAGWFFGSRKPVMAGSGIQHFVSAISAEPEAGDVSWLASTSPTADEDRARWELRYARRALGLLVAERDALDDRTASVAGKELRRALQMDRNVAAGLVHVAERQLNERIRAYRVGMEERVLGETAEQRLGRILLASAAAPVNGDALDRASGIARRYLAEANEALRRSVGEARLPADERPSAWKGGGGRTP